MYVSLSEKACVQLFAAHRQIPGQVIQSFFFFFLFFCFEMFIEKECALCVFITSLNEGGFNEIIYVKGLLLWVFPCLPFSILLHSKESSSTSFTDPRGACDIFCNPFPPPTALTHSCLRRPTAATMAGQRPDGSARAL